MPQRRVWVECREKLVCVNKSLWVVQGALRTTRVCRMQVGMLVAPAALVSVLMTNAQWSRPLLQRSGEKIKTIELLVVILVI